MAKQDTIKFLNEKIADNGDASDYAHTPLGVDSENIDRPDGRTGEETFIDLLNGVNLGKSLKYEDPFLYLLDGNGDTLSRVTLVLPSHKHEYTVTITKEATYTETGLKTYTCVCGHSYTEEIPMLIHDPAPVGEETKWNYTIDDINDIVTLNYYTGTDEDVIVYPQYVIDGKEYKTRIKSNDEEVYKNYMFADKKNIKSIVFKQGIDTSNVTSMYCMFSACHALTSLDVSNFDTSNVTNISCMFNYCRSLTSLDLSNFNTSSVTNMDRIFTGCMKLTTLDISSFDTTNTTDMHAMFFRCEVLATLDVSNFDTTNVTDIGSMFSDCKALTSLDVSNFDTSKVTYMSSIFSGCEALTSLDVSNFDTSKVIHMTYLFSYCKALTAIYVSKDKWITSQADTMDMFYGCNISEVTYK